MHYKLTPMPAISGFPVKAAAVQNSEMQASQTRAACELFVKLLALVFASVGQAASSTSEMFPYLEGKASRSIVNPDFPLIGADSGPLDIYLEPS
jgi:hypothetical protein